MIWFIFGFISGVVCTITYAALVGRESRREEEQQRSKKNEFDVEL